MNTYIIVAALVLFQAVDIVTTIIGLKHGGVELNPVARKLFGALGPLPAAILLKLIGTAPMIALAVLYPAYWYVPLAYSFILLGVVANNLFSL